VIFAASNSRLMATPEAARRGPGKNEARLARTTLPCGVRRQRRYCVQEGWYGSWGMYARHCLGVRFPAVAQIR
jgi:hypothetical protein